MMLFLPYSDAMQFTLCIQNLLLLFLLFVHDEGPITVSPPHFCPFGNRQKGNPCEIESATVTAMGRGRI